MKMSAIQPLCPSSSTKGVPPGPRLPVMSGQLQLQPPGSQQKGPAKSPAMSRQLNQPHPAISNTVRKTRPTLQKLVLSFKSILTASLFIPVRRRTTITTSSTATSPDRRLTTSSRGGWWEFSRGASSQVCNISGRIRSITCFNIVAMLKRELTLLFPPRNKNHNPKYSLWFLFQVKTQFSRPVM